MKILTACHIRGLEDAKDNNMIIMKYLWIFKCTKVVSTIHPE